MYDELKQKAYEANMLLRDYGLVELAFGNASVADREAGVFAIKPSGVPYEALSPAGMAVVDMEGVKVDGAFKPSSDTPTHLVLYRHFEEIAAVAHTHSRNAVAFAQGCREIPCYGTTHADFFRGPVPVTRTLEEEEVAGDYETATGEAIAERFREISPLDFPGVLVARHGPFAWGESGKKAAENALALEMLADAALKTEALCPDIAPMPTYYVERHFTRKHGPGRTYGQEDA